MRRIEKSNAMMVVVDAKEYKLRSVWQQKLNFPAKLKWLLVWQWPPKHRSGSKDGFDCDWRAIESTDIDTTRCRNGMAFLHAKSDNNANNISFPFLKRALCRSSSGLCGRSTGRAAYELGDEERSTASSMVRPTRSVSKRIIRAFES